MRYYSLILYLYIFFFVFHNSIESTPSTNDIITGETSENLTLFLHPLYFLSHICQRQKQYPLKITRKFCSSRSQEQQQQRGKRVGWTISV